MGAHSSRNVMTPFSNLRKCSHSEWQMGTQAQMSKGRPRPLVKTKLLLWSSLECKFITIRLQEFTLGSRNLVRRTFPTLSDNVRRAGVGSQEQGQLLFRCQSLWDTPSAICPACVVSTNKVVTEVIAEIKTVAHSDRPSPLRSAPPPLAQYRNLSGAGAQAPRRSLPLWSQLLISGGHTTKRRSVTPPTGSGSSQQPSSRFNLPRRSRASRGPRTSLRQSSLLLVSSMPSAVKSRTRSQSRIWYSCTSDGHIDLIHGFASIR